MGIQMESNIFRAIQNDLCYKIVVYIIDLLDIISYNPAEDNRSCMHMFII